MDVFKRQVMCELSRALLGNEVVVLSTVGFETIDTNQPYQSHLESWCEYAIYHLSVALHASGTFT